MDYDLLRDKTLPTFDIKLNTRNTRLHATVGQFGTLYQNEYVNRTRKRHLKPAARSSFYIINCKNRCKNCTHNSMTIVFTLYIYISSKLLNTCVTVLLTQLINFNDTIC